VELPPATAVVAPIIVELGEHLTTGLNKVQVARTENPSPINAVAISSYYVPWGGSSGRTEEEFLAGDTRALRLRVNYDSTDLRVNQWVRCQVEVERIGFKGYGVMQAEIGLPPGAQVDPNSLTRPDDVQPDRVVFYISAQPGGSRFEFRFRVRYPIEALTAPSILYDYYNPESCATVAPVRLTVR
jgi:hypothetical protein